MKKGESLEKSRNKVPENFEITYIRPYFKEQSTGH